MAAADPDSNGDEPFVLSDRRRARVYQQLQTYVPVHQNATPTLYRLWCERFPAGLIALRDSVRALPKIERKAVRYLRERFPPHLRHRARGSDSRFVLSAMRMVILFEERGFPWHELEAQYISSIYESNYDVRQYMLKHPDQNPYDIIARAGTEPPIVEDHDVHPEPLALDARRFAVLACTLKIPVWFMGKEGEATRYERGLIASVGPYHITTVREGVCTMLSQTFEPGVWVARGSTPPEDIEDNVPDYDFGPYGPASFYTFSWWSCDHNESVWRALESGTHDGPMRMRTESVPPQKADENLLGSNVPVDMDAEQ